MSTETFPTKSARSQSKARALPPLSFLDECFRLEADSGKLFWQYNRPLDHFQNKHTRINRTTKYGGKEAGSITFHGYLKVSMSPYGKFFAHRLIYALHYRTIPDACLQIDHINGEKLDNRPKNLRLVTASENLRNQRMYRNNTSGVHGVHWVKARQCWHAKIFVGGKLYPLGYFETIEEAAAARIEANHAHGFTERHGLNAKTPRGHNGYAGRC